MKLKWMRFALNQVLDGYLPGYEVKIFSKLAKTEDDWRLDEVFRTYSLVPSKQFDDWELTEIANLIYDLAYKGEQTEDRQ